MIHVSATHKVVGVPATPQTKGLWPQARTLTMPDQELILLPHAFSEVIILRNMGWDVPAPILTQYSWPGNEPPFHVQKLTAALFSTAQRCYCLNGLGTGKTRSTIWAFDYLRGSGLAKRALVIATLSTLDNTWRKELFQTTPHLSCGILHGTKQHRLKVLASKPDVLVINTDGIKVLSAELQELMSAGEIDTLIIDELALLRNGQSIRNKIARAMASKVAWVWGLTGSPTPNEPTDAWGQCRIVTPHTVPKFFGAFRDQTMVKINQFKYVPKRDAELVVFNAMQPAVRFTLDDVVELPPVVERVVDIPMGAKQAHVYEEIRKQAFAAVAGKEISAVNAGAVLNKLLQISLGYVYTSKKEVVSLDNDVRLDALVDAVNGTNRKVLVFVPFTHALEGVFKRLNGERIETAMVHGATPKDKRDHIFNLFQNTNKFKVIAAHPGCMSHGLTLTAANTIIWFGPTTSNETFEQANARIRRVGQDHKQLILMMQGSPAEKKIWARLRAKQKVQDNVLELFAAASAKEEA